MPPKLTCVRLDDQLHRNWGSLEPAPFRPRRSWRVSSYRQGRLLNCNTPVPATSLRAGSSQAPVMVQLNKKSEINGSGIANQGFDPISTVRKCGSEFGSTGTGFWARPASIRNAAIISASANLAVPARINTPLKFWSIRIFLLGMGIAALVIASITSLAKSADSCPPGPAQAKLIGIGAKGRSRDVSLLFCSAVNRRGLILASSLRRSIRSPSAILFASAACCYARAARSFAPAKFSSALPSRSMASPADFLASPASLLKRAISSCWWRSSEY